MFIFNKTDKNLYTFIIVKKNKRIRINMDLKNKNSNGNVENI